MDFVSESILYHIYPLGLCGAPLTQDDKLEYRLSQLEDWIPHFKELGVNGVCIGPVFQSSSHGYDTIDYRRIDCRLGDNDSFRALCKKLHENGVRIFLDGVFNHCGRDFFAFRDLREKKWDSPYKDWFCWVDFGRDTYFGDGFSYEGWEGHLELAKLNLRNPAVVEYLLESVRFWIQEWDIDGLRIDAANCIDPDFLRRLRSFTTEVKPDFWMFGEVIHGDYNRWAGEGLLHSVTNYECYKGLYSSHNSKNYFEIAYSLNRQFGQGGIYKNLCLYNFVDNHDVNRLASTVSRPEYLKNIYTILYTMPGVPSLYYGSEFGIKGMRTKESDRELRPALRLDSIPEKNEELLSHLKKLGKIRRELAPLQKGEYFQVIVKNEQLVYCRSLPEEQVYVALNLAESPAELEFQVLGEKLTEMLQGTVYQVENNRLRISVPPFSGMVLSSRGE